MHMRLYPGPTLPISEETHAKKHRQPGETFLQAMDRITARLGDGPKHSARLHDAMADQRLILGGRVQSAIGSERRITAFNCYVSGTIEDSLFAGEGNIMQRLAEAATTWAMGGGMGFDFSTLRFRDAPIGGLGSTSSGAVSFIGPYNATSKTIRSAGHRRAASMGVMRIDHPDVEEFIEAKRNDSALSEFNISLAITDEFMEAVLADAPFDLRFGGLVVRTVRARDLWEKIMESTWAWADPGVLFIDRINGMNNLWYCERIAATNPCGEQPLPPFGACNLGALNLVKYLIRQAGFYTFAWDQFAEDVATAVRAMDRVIDESLYPLPQQQREAKAKRRIGLGIMGLANALETMGLPYGSSGFVSMTHDIMARLARESYIASATLAAERGAFELFDADMYLQGKFIRTLDADVQDMIRCCGMRNSHLNTVAPTGTTAITANNVSSGVEPVFAHEYDRLIFKASGEQVSERVTDYAYRELGVKGRTTNEVTVDEHVDVLCAVQAHIDSAVSKTVNVDGDGPVRVGTLSYEAFKDVYVKAWRGGAKGCTTYNKNGRRGAILTDASETPAAEEPLPEYEDNACKWDPATGIRSCEA